MLIRVIDRPVEGDPILLQPDGELVRWPRDEPLPEVGDRFPRGTVLTVTHPQHRAALNDLLHGNILERCEAATRLPVPVLCAFYSYSQAMNLRRVGRSLSPAFKAHIKYLLDQGFTVSSKMLIRVAAKRTEAQQLATWSKLLE